MLSFDEYADRFEKVAITRSDTGVITLRLHSGGGPFVYDAAAHAELPFALRCVADDVDNRVVVLTGTGDSFWSLLNPPSFAHLQHTPDGWDQTLFEERRTLEAFLSIDVPIISAVNGPALAHSHLPVMADIVLASETACFGDVLHAPGGVVPGDGAHMIWTKLLGLNRGRYFLLTGQSISAAEALGLGVVAEVLPPDGLMKRAQELAEELAAKPTLMLRQTRSVLRHELDQTMVRDFSRGMMHEAVAGLSSLSKHLVDATQEPAPVEEHFILDPSTGESRPLKPD